MNVKSIQFRLTVWYTLLIIVAAIGFGAYTYYSLEHRLYEEIQTMLARRIVVRFSNPLIPDMLDDLSGKEYALLEYLALNTGRILSRAMIVEHVWDQGFENLTNIVDVYIRQLRVKIDDGHERKLIHTVRGRGYVFDDETSP